MKNSFKFFSAIAVSTIISVASLGQTYKIVGTGQTNSYNNSSIIATPTEGQSFFGQNANHLGNSPAYIDNGNGTISDNVSGLMWEKTPDKNGDGTVNYYDKTTYSLALTGASLCNTGGYSDWRLPTIKELYSLIMYYGAEPSPTATSQGTAVPYINTNYFNFGFGDLNASSHGATANERLIDAQYVTSSIYVSTTMGGNATMFGVNFADGRIKGYPSGNQKKYYILYVRDNTAYGINSFVDNGDGTIIDSASGLMWMQSDNGSAISWENALSYAEEFSFAGHTNWRLPDAKELQSIIDYSRSPATTNSAAINPIFNCTQITNEAAAVDYGYYWSSTTFCSQTPTNGTDACYLSFGRAMGYMSILGGWVDVHGAGAQRSDPKTGNPESFPEGFGPQGDAIRIYNYVRLVRNVELANGLVENKLKETIQVYPNPASEFIKVSNSNSVVNGKLVIYNTSGVLVHQENALAKGEVSINVSNFPKGLYFLKVITENTTQSGKFIVQ